MPAEVPIAKQFAMTNRSDREPNEEAERINLSAVLVDSAECGVVIASAETRLVWLNTAAERMIGMDAARLLTQSIDALPEPLAHVMAECFARRVHLSNRQVLIAQPGGDVLLEVQSIPVAGAKDDSATVVALLRDLSASRRLEERIRQLDRLADVGALSADVAHEVKNALVAIKTFTELVPSSNKDEEARALVKREVQRIDSLVSQLLRFAAPAKPGAMRLSAHEVIDNAQISTSLLQFCIKISILRRFGAI